VKPRPAATRTIFEKAGELSAANEVRRLFPGITDNAKGACPDYRRVAADGCSGAEARSQKEMRQITHRLGWGIE
jgi:hypothetical protein